MAYVFTASNHFKYMLATQQVDLDTDALYIALVRDGFVFNKDTHATYLNITAVSAAATMIFSAGSKTITRPTGNFVTEGFVVGNRITTSTALNPGPFTITAVTALELTVSETVVNETAGCVVTCHDELPNGFGYTTGGELLVVTPLFEDDGDNRAELAFNDVVWTATGGPIGPTSGAIIFDSSTGDLTIVGHLDFGADQLIADGLTLGITDNELRHS